MNEQFLVVIFEFFVYVSLTSERGTPCLKLMTLSEEEAAKGLLPFTRECYSR